MRTNIQNNEDRRLYNDLAWIWPIVSPPADYLDEAKEFHELIQVHGRRDTRDVLHLGCGAGHLDSHLKHHYRITGVDLSEPLLALAGSLNPEATYHRGDMRSFHMETAFDAVILADASDYLLAPDELHQTCAAAYRHLRPGGVFCTYAEEIAEKFEQNKTRTSVHKKGIYEITSLENVYDPDPADTIYELTLVYLIRKGGELQIEYDRHQVGLFPTSTWIEQLEAAGFKVKMIDYEGSGPMFIGKK